MRIENIVKNYFNKQNRILCVYLFGSIATGTENKFSDVDIAVLFDNNVPPVQYTQRQLCIMDELSRILDKDVDVVVLNTANSFLKFIIIKTGRKVYDEANRTDHNFEVRVIREYFDFLPVRKKLEEALINHIKRG